MSLTGGLSAGLVAGLNGRAMAGVSAWTPMSLPGTPREWRAGPDWCYTDGSAAFAAASSQSLSVASNSTLQTGDVDFWVAGWFNLTSYAGSRGIVTKTNGASDHEFQLFTSGVTLYFDTLTSGSTVVGRVSTPAPTVGTWVFVVGYQSVASNRVGLSVNGGAFVTATRTGTPTTSSTAFTIGGFAGSLYADGRIASVAFGKSPPGGIAAIATTIRDRLYASGNGIVYADTTAAERTAWGLVSWWDLVRSGVFTDSHGTNNLTNNNGVTFGAGLPRSRAGDTDPISAWVDRWQGTTVTQSDPLKRPTLRLVSDKWCVRFDGVNDALENSGVSFLSGVPGFSTWLAADWVAVFGNRLALALPGNSGNLQAFGYKIYTYSEAGVSGRAGIAAGVRRVVSVFDGSATGNADRLRGWLDGTPLALTYTGTVGGTSGTGTGMVIGDAASTPVVPFQGDIASVGCAESTPNAAAITALDAYLEGVM